MGNIHREVFPDKVMSRRRRASAAVKRISMHQPVRPHFRKLWKKVEEGCFFVRFWPEVMWFSSIAVDFPRYGQRNHPGRVSGSIGWPGKSDFMQNALCCRDMAQTVRCRHMEKGKAGMFSLFAKSGKSCILSLSQEGSKVRETAAAGGGSRGGL